MKIENTEVYGFHSAIRACRNPLDSWAKSDSTIGMPDFYVPYEKNNNTERFLLGADDRALSQRLVKAGTEHCKHLRMIQVWADITLPRFIWSEFDTYRHVEKISCSTMHTLMKKPITEGMFEDGYCLPSNYIELLTLYVSTYNNNENPSIKKKIKYYTKASLPESFLQKRTINTSYQTLLNMYNQRKNHELPQWHTICDWILYLPYFTELTGISDETK